ncbi:MAG: hypothetical protein HRU80_02740 [Ignavibacteriales bacterium]|nr:MAG: hypothetical protein HRU80_02740 [Ignavibacteriales bacterium]
MRRLALFLGSFIKKHRVFFFQITASILLCFSLLALFPYKSDKYIVVDLSNMYFAPDFESAFIDFEGDGITERVFLGYDLLLKQSSLVLFNGKGNIIDQWNFSERWLPKFSFSGDYNNDGDKEYYVFTQKEDSLFLYIIDPLLKPHFYKKRLFMAKAENVFLNPVGKWDVYFHGALFTDLNQDGINELVLSIHSGFSQFPRKTIVYDLVKLKIVAQTPRWGMPLGYPNFVTTDRGDSLFYFRLSVSSFNIHGDIKYKDDKTWFVTLDKNLNPLFQPIPFGKEFSGLTTFATTSGDSLLFTLISTNYGTDIKKSTLYTITAGGNILQTMRLPVSNNYTLFQIPDLFPNTNFLCTNDSLFIVDQNLSLHFFKSVPALFEFTAEIKLGSDSEKKLLFLDLTHYWITDTTLSEFTKIDMHFDPLRYKVHSIQGYYNGANLAIETSDGIYFVNYKPNPWYPYRYIYPAGLFVVCFGFVFSGYWYIKRRIFFHHFSDQLFLNAQRGIILLDHKGKIVKINSAIKDLLKMNHSMHRGARFSTEFASFPVLRDTFSSMVLNKKTVVRDFTLQHKDETLRLQINGYPLHKENSDPVGYLIEILDYSDPIHKERMNMWSDTVKRFAHDLKTPLSSLFLMADNLQQKIEEYPKEIHRQMLTDLKYFTGEITRLKKMTKRFAQFSDFQNAHFSRVSVALIVRNALDELYSLITPGITITNLAEKEEITILGDALQLQQVMQILIKNAIEALSGSGEILIKSYLAQNLKTDSLDMCTIDVCDNGCGINDEHRSKLFEPFFTTKTDGSGLGLSIAKKIILEHHGQIYITESTAYSTIVRVMLPTGNNGVADV